MDNLITPFDEKVDNVVVDNKINKAVKHILKHHSGDLADIDLDKDYKDVIQALYDMVDKHTDPYCAVFVVTGKFGILFNNWIQMNGFGIERTLLMEKESLNLFEPFVDFIGERMFVIIDDIIFPGYDNDYIKNYIVSLGGVYKGTFVIYDELKGTDPDIHSLYKREL